MCDGSGTHGPLGFSSKRRYIFIQPHEAELHKRFTTFRDVSAHLSDESEGVVADSPQLPIDGARVDVSFRDTVKR